MKARLKKIGYWTSVISIGIAVGLTLQFAKAWTEPTEAPPGGNVGAPINTSGTSQIKLGVITAGSFATDGSVSGSSFCLGDSPCIKNWRPSQWETARISNIFYAGRVGIGTSDPSTSKLRVDGDIWTKQICDYDGNNCKPIASISTSGPSAETDPSVQSWAKNGGTCSNCGTCWNAEQYVYNRRCQGGEGCTSYYYWRMCTPTGWTQISSNGTFDSSPISAGGG